MRIRIETAIAEDRVALETALATGRYDSSQPLDSVRKMLFEQEVERFRPEDYPGKCPDILLDSVCNIFGHFCPVFFVPKLSPRHQRGDDEDDISHLLSKCG